MKKLEIILRKEKLDDAIKAIKKIGVGGLSVSEVQGQGAEEEPLVGQSYTRSVIMTVVEDEKVNPILKSVGDAACTETKGDGKIFISNIEEVMDLCTKECGHTVL
ncbi:MAG: P-II family nitrogen regulator [Nitrosopumilaceae archaeon]|nr:P-II family nitrogen regulator [Nitrosopumilaceae archaeon]